MAAQSATTQAPRPAAPQPAPAGQKPAGQPAPEPKPPAGQVAPEGVTPPPDYVIGAEDVLEVIVWREKDLSAEVMVRPDGLVSLPLLNDVQAGGPHARAIPRPRLHAPSPSSSRRRASR